MKTRKMLATGLGVGIIASAAFVGQAGAHNTPAACVLLNSPAQVNNVEFGTLSDPLNKMSKATAGHVNQKTGLGGRYGLYYPVTDPYNTGTAPGSSPGQHMQLAPANNHGLNLTATTGDNFNWSQTGSCANDNTPYRASGTGIGYCGRSVGLGVGTIATHSTIIKWESAATQLVLTDTTAFGSVNAQAAPPGTPTGSCLDGGATVFAVDGVLAHK